mmetsp:Transcript_22481/g.53782  ORF Transcript_22481/g.53782 Transcript_22481/m.53782 type:complete len:524 (+) Transcript_22481:1070-2641(+)
MTCSPWGPRRGGPRVARKGHSREPPPRSARMAVCTKPEVRGALRTERMRSHHSGWTTTLTTTTASSRGGHCLERTMQQVSGCSGSAEGSAPRRHRIALLTGLEVAWLGPQKPQERYAGPLGMERGLVLIVQAFSSCALRAVDQSCKPSEEPADGVGCRLLLPLLLIQLHVLNKLCHLPDSLSEKRTLHRVAAPGRLQKLAHAWVQGVRQRGAQVRVAHCHGDLQGGHVELLVGDLLSDELRRHDRPREDIGLGVVDVVLHDFRRHVQVRPGFPREDGGGLHGEPPRETHVGDARRAAGVQQDVGGLEVAVHDLRLGLLQGLHAARNLERFAQPSRQRGSPGRHAGVAVAVEPGLEGAAGHPLRQDPAAVRGVEHRADEGQHEGVPNGAHHVHFAQEAHDLVPRLHADGLEGDVAPVPGGVVCHPKGPPPRLRAELHHRWVDQPAAGDAPLAQLLPLLLVECLGEAARPSHVIRLLFRFLFRVFVAVILGGPVGGRCSRRTDPSIVPALSTRFRKFLGDFLRPP